MKTGGSFPLSHPAARDLGSPFEMQVQRHGGMTFVHLLREFDLAAKERFEDSLADMTWDGLTELVVDLRGLTFIDSTGLGLLLELWNRCRREGLDLAIIRARGGVQQVFETSGLDRVLPIIDGLPLERDAVTAPNLRTSFLLREKRRQA